MANDDDYDAYNLSLDIEELGPYIISLPPSPPTTVTTGHPSQETRTSQEEETQELPPEESHESQSSDADVFYTAPSTQLDAHHSDSYSDYDLSEFTADDFASIDAAVASAGESSTRTLKRTSTVPASFSSDGPAVPVVLEGASQTLQSMDPPALPHARTARVSTALVRQRTKEPSPFERFRSYRGILSVTDLTSPSWCEVQFDYGLRQQRFKKVEDRPTDFKTATGKTIPVDQSIAVVNDRITQRGRSVHQVLERELHPEVIQVKTTSEEERWGLRLVNMIASMQSLLSVGRCREMNVFGILNSQVITGIIDEVERRPIGLPPPSPRSNLKRSPSKSNAPTTPTRRQSKRARRSISPSQLPLTNFFSSSPSRTDSQADVYSSPLLEDKCIQVSSPPHTSGLVLTPLPIKPSPLPDPPQFRLHLSDTKTRRVPTIPSHDDTLSARMQLMVYHRLLSNLLTSPTESEDALDFQNLWTRMHVDHRRPFSKAFCDSAGLMFDGGLGSHALNCLDDLTHAWRNVVEMLSISGVDDCLTVVYRTQHVKVTKKGGRSRERKPVDELISEEANDIVNAVIASLDSEVASSCGQETIKGSLQTMLAEVTSAGELASEPEPDAADDASLQWAIQQSILEQVRQRHHLKDAVLAGGTVSNPPSPTVNPSAAGADGDEDSIEASDAPPESIVIGTKTFQMHELTLNSYLKSVLDWWYGRRPPKGVDLHLTKRCLSCEYQEGCEWRETKAAEWRRRKGHL